MRAVRWRFCTATLVGLVLALTLLNIPFYAGSSLGSSAAWRLEHGRLTVKWGAASGNESFFIALNSEGLKWAPRCSFASIREASLTIPLWMVFLGTSGVAVIVWKREARKTGIG